jgi:hypothetical protein
MEHSLPAYGLWSLVIINAGIFLLFAFSFFKPRTPRDWRTFGTFSAFIVKKPSFIFHANSNLERSVKFG